MAIAREQEMKALAQEARAKVIEAECDPNPDIDSATPAKVTSEIKEAIEAIPLPPGYSMRWVGEGELQNEAIGNVMKFMPITLLLILAILLLLFNSWRKVFLILACFPFVFCGITAALLISNNPFTFMAIIGMMGLIGMMVKNAIVLVDEINRLHTRENMHPYNAVVEATVSRVRPRAYGIIDNNRRNDSPCQRPHVWLNGHNHHGWSDSWNSHNPDSVTVILHSPIPYQKTRQNSVKITARQNELPHKNTVSHGNRGNHCLGRHGTREHLADTG